MGLRVNVVCRNLHEDRVIPRFSRYLADRLGWTLTRRPDPNAEVVYLSAYFESQVCRQWPKVPVAAFFTHREEQPPGNAKAKLFDQMAGRVQLRVAMCQLYAEPLSRYGPTIQPPLPVERKRFTIPKSRNGRIVAGFSGYTYVNKRKGEDLVRPVLASQAGQRLTWKASGRGWPVPTVRYAWKNMPAFYQSLDILVCTARVEGGPMPPLEALSCGVSVVVPRGVGILDELPDVPGIHRYKRGDAGALVKALGRAIEARGDVDRGALRAATEPYSVAAWCRAHEEAFVGEFDELNAGMALESQDVSEPIEVDGELGIGDSSLVSGKHQRGIYVVAFGDPARKCAQRLMKTAKQHMPDIPICLCAAKKIGPEDLLVIQPDSDIGGRRAKLKAYQLTPKEWTSVLYLDADTKVVAPIYFFFELIEDGWEFVICKDPHLMDTMFHYRRKNNLAELEETEKKIHTLHTLQYNGGVWAFGRNARVARFFARWLKGWDKYAGRDQGALIRAMYTEPLRVYLLGNEWNTFPKYTKGITTAGLMHYPGDARRWKGIIPGRIDSDAAWAAVDRFMAQRRGPAQERRSSRRR
jgi:hypothetical protein